MDPLIGIEEYKGMLSRRQVSVREAIALATRRFFDIDGQGSLAFRTFSDQLAEEELEVSPVGHRSLDGVLISVKDSFDIEGQVTVAGSPGRLSLPPAQRDSAAVRALRNAGALIVGRTNMPEYAYSVTGVNITFGTPANPFDRLSKRLPGGSTSGGAVSVADGMAHIALGTDTGGSLRVPAALCGLVGFRPSIGRISTEGVFPLSRSSDVVGTIGHCVKDCWLVDSALSGKQSATALPSRAIDSLKLIVPNQLLRDLDDHVARSFESALGRLSRAGAAIQHLSLPILDGLQSLYTNGGVTAAEAWRDTAQRSADFECYDPLVRSRVLRGAVISDDEYLAMCRARSRAARQFTSEMAAFDALLCPTVTCVAPTLDYTLSSQAQHDLVNTRLLKNTVPITLVRGCAVSLPCHPEGTAPVGAMLAMPEGLDDSLFAIAASIEAHLRES